MSDYTWHFLRTAKAMIPMASTAIRSVPRIRFAGGDDRYGSEFGVLLGIIGEINERNTRNTHEARKNFFAAWKYPPIDAGYGTLR